MELESRWVFTRGWGWGLGSDHWRVQGFSEGDEDVLELDRSHDHTTLWME